MKFCRPVRVRFKLVNYGWSWPKGQAQKLASCCINSTLVLNCTKKPLKENWVQLNLAFFNNCPKSITLTECREADLAEIAHKSDLRICWFLEHVYIKLCTWEVWRAWMCEATSKSNSIFLSALQTFQVHPQLNTEAILLSHGKNNLGAKTCFTWKWLQSSRNA